MLITSTTVCESHETTRCKSAVCSFTQSKYSLLLTLFNFTLHRLHLGSGCAAAAPFQPSGQSSAACLLPRSDFI